MRVLSQRSGGGRPDVSEIWSGGRVLEGDGQPRDRQGSIRLHKGPGGPVRLQGPQSPKRGDDGALLPRWIGPDASRGRKGNGPRSTRSHSAGRRSWRDRGISQHTHRTPPWGLCDGSNSSASEAQPVREFLRETVYRSRHYRSAGAMRKRVGQLVRMRVVGGPLGARPRPRKVSARPLRQSPLFLVDVSG